MERKQSDNVTKWQCNNVLALGILMRDMMGFMRMLLVEMDIDGCVGDGGSEYGEFVAVDAKALGDVVDVVGVASCESVVDADGECGM